MGRPLATADSREEERTTNEKVDGGKNEKRAKKAKKNKTGRFKERKWSKRFP